MLAAVMKAERIILFSAIFAIFAGNGAYAASETVIHSFSGDDGSLPGGLAIGTNGTLYGSTTNGGALGNGVFYSVTSAGSFSQLSAFGNKTGIEPYGAPLVASNGEFYGTTNAGGKNNLGTVYQATATGSVSAIFNMKAEKGGHRSSKSTSGDRPELGLTEGSDGYLYGATEFGGSVGAGTVFKTTTSGTLTTLFSLGTLTYVKGITEGSDGAFYAVGSVGGASATGGILRFTSSGTVTTLYNFSSLANGLNADGATPDGALTLGPDGALYGSTQEGGSNGSGTLFKITNAGVLTVLHAFGITDGTGINADGATPQAAMTLGIDGNLYGSTGTGGSNGTGTLFSLTTNGALTTLYSFAAATTTNTFYGTKVGTDGATPNSALVEVSNGIFYGTTYTGGPSGVGTIFKLQTQ